MDQVPEPLSAGRAMARASRTKRIVIGVILIIGSFLAIAFDRWMLSSSRWIYLLMVPVTAYVLFLVLRPEWIARMEKREEERLKNWRTHPGQWMR